MKLIVTIATAAIVCFSAAVVASPESDRAAFAEYYTKRFSDTPKEDFVNGIYSIDAASREQWEEIEEFPPYEIDVDTGRDLFETPFANGKTYASCFEEDGIGVRQNYPRWDATQGQVVTLELAINQCREANGEKPLKYKKGAIASISAYMAYTSRGKPIAVEVPADDAGAMAAYENGKEFYYTKRGQLNFSCADCHMGNAGNYVRADRLSPALGHTSHFPVYRSKWGELGTLHRRFGGCNNNIRAKAFKPQGKEYRNLEFFLTYMSNGLEFNGPGARK